MNTRTFLSMTVGAILRENQLTIVYLALVQKDQSRTHRLTSSQLTLLSSDQKLEVFPALFGMTSGKKIYLESLCCQAAEV